VPAVPVTCHTVLCSLLVNLGPCVDSPVPVCLPEVRGRMQCSQAPYKNDKAFSFLFDTWTEELSAEEVRPILDIDFHRPTLGMLLAGMVVIPAF